MPQHLYVAKPSKVLAEQYDGTTVPEGACACNHTGPGAPPDVYEPAGHPPHVHDPVRGAVMLEATDWLLSDRWTGAPTGVLTDAQFQDVYGAGPPAEG